ncbi:hypothetical protein AB6813_22020 [bacterium RCC_150]
MNRSLSRGLFFGAGFGCAYVVVVLALTASNGLGLSILGGLGGALVGALAGFLIAALILGVVRLTRIPRDLEPILATAIVGASTLLLLLALDSVPNSTSPLWMHPISAGVAAAVGGLAWPRAKAVVGESR